MTQQTSSIDNEITDELVLDLTIATDVVFLQKDQQFQREAKQALFKRIEGFVKRIPDDENADNITSRKNRLFYERNHNAITVCGSRGTGKSTFLKNSLSELDVGIKYSDGSESSLLILPVIDPTLISSKENVLVLVISLIKEEVESKSNVESELYEKWRSALKDLAGGLCQVDGIGSNKGYGDEWEDKTYIMETGLEKARQGLSLEKTLNKFIHLSLKALNKKAVVISFDDIDTQFERGWPVLEAVRKHLTSPQLVILISGDIDLYRTLIRRAVIDSIGESIFEYDRASNKHHNKVSSWADDQIINKVNRLEEQYLLKVLKPENRIHMKSLREIIDANRKLKVFVRDEEKKIEKQSLEEYLKSIFELGFSIKNEKAINDFKISIISMPARTIWQLLKASRVLNEPSKNSNSLLLFRDSVLDIFSSSYLQYNDSNVDLSSSYKPEQSIFLSTWNWLIKARLHRLTNPIYPTYDDVTNNQMAIVFSVFSESLKQYSFKDLLSLSLKNAGLYKVFAKYESHEVDIMNYLASNNDSSVADFVHRTNAILRDNPVTLTLSIPNFQDYKLKWAMTRIFGTKKISSLKEFKEKVDFSSTVTAIGKNEFLASYWSSLQVEYDNDINKVKALGGVFNTLDSISRNYNGIGNIPLLCCTNINDPKKSERYSYVSVSNLLALIAECLETDSKSQLISKLKVLANQDILPRPSFISDSIDGEGQGSDEDSAEFLNDEDNSWNEFLAILYNWVEKVNQLFKEKKISQRTIEQSFKRFYESIDSMHDYVKKVEPYLGNIVHRQLISFLGSLHFEEQKAIDNHLSLDSKKISTDDRVFIQNLNKKSKKNPSYEPLLNDELTLFNFEGAPLLEIFFTCPLIGVFLCPHDVSVSGRNKKTINWLSLHKQALSDIFKSNPEFKVSDYEASLKLIKTSAKDKAFDGLWDVLNSVPINTSEKFKSVTDNLIKVKTQSKAKQDSDKDDTTDTTEKGADNEAVSRGELVGKTDRSIEDSELLKTELEKKKPDDSNE